MVNFLINHSRFEKFLAIVMISILSTIFFSSGFPPQGGMRPNSGIEKAEAAEEYQFITKWGTLGSGDGQFDRPRGIVQDGGGNVYVADTWNNRIQKFDSNGAFITKWGSSGSGDGQFDSPWGIAVDRGGNVYVADWNNYRIQKFDSNGNFITKWGSNGSADGQFNLPQGVALDGDDNVYVADRGNDRIQKFDSNGAFITKWGSNGSADGQFDSPYAVAVDGIGNVYVADAANDRIQKFDSTGNFLTKWGSSGPGDGQFNVPGGVAVDESGNVYVADVANDRIQKFDSNGAFITKWGSSGSADGQFSSPWDIVVDGSGNAFVEDTWNNRIQKFSLNITPPTTILATNPITPDGNNGWFKTTPSITLSRNEPGTTYYSWNSSTGPWTTYSVPFSAPEGENTLYYYSVDTAGNTEAVKSQPFKVDTQSPTNFTLNVPADGATINKPYPYFSWNASLDQTSGLAKYQLYIDGSLARDNIVNWNAAVPSTGLPNGPHTWFVRAWDNAGNFRDSTTRSFTVNSGPGKITFTSNRHGNPEIYIMNADGSNQTRLTINPAGDNFPSLSPDGSKIVFTSNRDGNDEIYIMNSDGSNQTRVTNDPAWDGEPVFTPNGSKIVSESTRSGTYELYQVNLDGSNLTQLTSGGPNGSPAVSPDGRRVAYTSGTGQNDILIMNFDGTGLTNLTNSIVFDDDPNFSPDGQKITWTITTAAGYAGPWEVYLMNADGSNKQNLTNNPASDWYPAFSPDGGRIVFASDRDGNNEIYTMNPDGSGLTRLTSHPANDGWPSWGPAAPPPSDTTPPSAPTNLNAIPISTSQIDLFWNASTDNVGVVGYKVYNQLTNAEIATTTGTSYSHTGLSPGTTYKYYVKAFDAAGNFSSPSNTASATTFAGGADNTLPGTNVEVPLGNGVILTFENVTGPGTTSVTVSNTPPGGAPSGFRFQGYYYDVTTTASYSGFIIVRLPYNEADVRGKEENLKLMHWTGTGWEDVTVSVDTVNNIITGRVTSLSIFGVGEPVVPTGLNTYWLLVTSIFMMIGGGYLLARGKKRFV